MAGASGLLGTWATTGVVPVLASEVPASLTAYTDQVYFAPAVSPAPGAGP
jgi:hypothetical protein